MKKSTLLIFAALLPLIASAYDAKINGISYNFRGNEAEVTYSNNDNTTNYSGNVVIPESVTYDGKTYSVTSIGNGAFGNCSSLTAVTIPESVTSIGHWAFQGCRSLSSVIIPNGVTVINQGVFMNCSALTSVIIHDNVTSIDIVAFSNCGSLTSITIPNDVTSIGNGAFGYCRSLTSITIPEGITTIGFGTFQHCTSLTSVTMPNSLTSIESEAFANCNALPSVVIPKNVSNIEDCAFQDCRSLTDVYCYATEPPSVYTTEHEGDVWDGYPFNPYYIKEHSTLHVPTASVEKYKTALRWSEFANIVALPEPVTFTQDQMATIILPTAPDASKGKYYRLDRVEDKQIVFEQELQPRAHVPYIIVPSEDFSIDINDMDLEGLQSDTVTVEGVSFIGSYVRKELPALTGGDGGGSFYIDIIDTTPDCSHLPVEEQGVSLYVGALRAYLLVHWDDPYNPGGTKAPTDKMEIVLKDNPNSIRTLSNSPLKGEDIYDLSGRKLSTLNFQISTKKKAIYIQNNRKLVK